MYKYTSFLLILSSSSVNSRCEYVNETLFIQKKKSPQINNENLRLLDSLKEINESDYAAKTDKIVGRMSIGNVGKGQTLPVKPWSDCYNEAVNFIRPKVRECFFFCILLESVQQFSNSQSITTNIL